jgi:hypothetical protein
MLVALYQSRVIFYSALTVSKVRESGRKHLLGQACHWFLDG